MSTPEEVRYETERSLLEWGVDPMRDKRHRDFYDGVVRRAVLCFRLEEEGGEGRAGNDATGWMPGDGASSPDEERGGVENVLRNLFASDLRHARGAGGIVGLVTDSLPSPAATVVGGLTDAEPSPGGGMAWVPPFRVRYDRHWREATRSARYRIRSDRREELLQLRRADLDPFARFGAVVVPAGEYHYRRLAGRARSREAGLLAAAASRAAWGGAVRCCTCRDRTGLDWRSAAPGAWEHLRCSSCLSGYTVIVRGGGEDPPSAPSAGDGSGEGRQRGGSFGGCPLWLRRRSAADGRKHFLAVVHRGRLDGPGERNRGWRVHISEIGTVLPRLVPESFLPRCEEGGGIPGALAEPPVIQSWIKTVPRSRKLWFDIPLARGLDFETKAGVIARSVYDEHFPGHWGRLEAELPAITATVLPNGGEGMGSDCETLMTDASTPEKVIQDLRDRLDEMKSAGGGGEGGGVSLAGWEDVYPSD